VALKLYSISLDDFAVKIRVAKGATNRLARDRADLFEDVLGLFVRNRQASFLNQFLLAALNHGSFPANAQSS
jgi:hypothetical protein